MSLGAWAEELAVVPAGVSSGKVGALGERALTLTRREVGALQRGLHAWEKDPAARIFTKGGHTEHEVRPQTQAMIGFAVVARFGPEEAERAAALGDLVAMLRFVAPTHSMGEMTCSDGKKWKGQWQSALWAYQAGVAAWLVWERIPEDLKPLIANMVAVEADRFVGQDPPHQIKNDTKAEENAWNATVVSLAACMMPGDARAGAWRETAVRWQLSSFLTEEDTRSAKVVDGKAIRDYKLGANIHPDYSLENHNRVHPSYMSTIGLNLMQHFSYRWAKAKSPEALNYNAGPIYTLLKRFSHPDGRMHFPNGQDWELHRWTPSVHAKMNVLFNDPEAAYLERMSLETMEKMQARSAEGGTMLREEYIFPSFPGMVVTGYAVTFLIHLEYGEGAPPCSEEEFLRKNTGVWEMKDGQFIFQRTGKGFVSFSWGSRVMGQAIPFTLDLLGSPYEAGFVGTIAAEGESQRTLSPRVEEMRVTKREDGFEVAARLSRCGGAVEQKVAFVSLGEGRVVYAQQIKALREVKLKTMQTGTIGIINEPEWVYQAGPRKIAWAGGKAEIDGREALAPVEYKTEWLSVADGWTFYPVGAEGLVLSGSGKASRRRREQIMHLSGPGKMAFSAGEVIATNGVVVEMKGRSGEVTGKVVEGGMEVKVGGRGMRIGFGEGLPVVR